MKKFHIALATALQRHGLRLSAANLGRLKGTAVWVVTYAGRDGVLYQSNVTVSDPAYDQAPFVADQIASSQRG